MTIHDPFLLWDGRGGRPDSSSSHRPTYPGTFGAGSRSRGEAIGAPAWLSMALQGRACVRLVEAEAVAAGARSVDWSGGSVNHCCAHMPMTSRTGPRERPFSVRRYSTR